MKTTLTQSGLVDVPVLPGLGHAIRAVLAGFATLPQGIRAMHDYERLSRLSDAGLAKRGLTRGDLPAHVIARNFPEA